MIQHIVGNMQLPPRLEQLESRRLMVFTTVDVVPVGEFSAGMAIDAAGNVYVGGYGGPDVSVVRQSADGGATWGNILELPFLHPTGGYTEIYGIAASPAGDVYAGVNGGGAAWRVLQRPAGATAFVEVARSASGSIDYYNPLTVDSAGNAYAVGTDLVSVQGPGNKITYQVRWSVRRQTGGAGNFSTVDQFYATGQDRPAAVSVVEGGAGQGVYVAGQSGNRWLVRKSPTGAHGTWTTVDSFQFDAADNQTSYAVAVTADAAGNVHVAGTGMQRERTGGTVKKPVYTTTRHQLVRSSADGGTTWTTDSSILPGNNTYIEGMSADAAGNVYAVGHSGATNSSVLRVKSAGIGWTTIDDFANAYGWGVTSTANGDLYVAGGADGPLGDPYGVYGFVRKMDALAAAPRFSAAPIEATFDDPSQREHLLDLIS